VVIVRVSVYEWVCGEADRLSISSHRCHLKQLSSSHRAIHTDMFALCRTTFPRGPTLSEKERNRNAPLCHSFFSNLSLHPYSPSSLHFAVLLRADVSYHTAQRYVSGTHTLTHVCKQIHTLIITLRDMSTLSPFSRGQWKSLHAY